MSKRPIGQATPTIEELEPKLEAAEQRIKELIRQRENLFIASDRYRNRIKELETFKRDVGEWFDSPSEDLDDLYKLIKGDV